MVKIPPQPHLPEGRDCEHQTSQSVASAGVRPVADARLTNQQPPTGRRQEVYERFCQWIYDRTTRKNKAAEFPAGATDAKNSTSTKMPVATLAEVTEENNAIPACSYPGRSAAPHASHKAKSPLFRCSIIGGALLLIATGLVLWKGEVNVFNGWSFSVDVDVDVDIEVNSPNSDMTNADSKPTAAIESKEANEKKATFTPSL